MDKRITFEEAYSKLGVDQFTLQGLLSTGDFQSWDGETVDFKDFIRLCFALNTSQALALQDKFIGTIISHYQD